MAFWNRKKTEAPLINKSEEWYVSNADTIKKWDDHFKAIYNFSDEFFDEFKDEIDDIDLLKWSCSKQNKSAANRALRNGLDINDIEVMRFAFIFANQGSLKEVKFIIELGFDINKKASSGMDMLNASVFGLNNFFIEKENERRKKLEVWKFLIKSGANPFTTSELAKSSAFHQLCCLENDDVGSILITCYYFDGADLDVRNESGETALMLAARYGREHTVETLLSKGANPTLKNKSGDTAAIICLQGSLSFNEGKHRRLSKKILDYDQIFRSKYAPEVYKK